MVLVVLVIIAILALFLWETLKTRPTTATDRKRQECVEDCGTSSEVPCKRAETTHTAPVSLNEGSQHCDANVNDTDEIKACGKTSDIAPEDETRAVGSGRPESSIERSGQEGGVGVFAAGETLDVELEPAATSSAAVTSPASSATTIPPGVDTATVDCKTEVNDDDHDESGIVAKVNTRGLRPGDLKLAFVSEVCARVAHESEYSGIVPLATAVLAVQMAKGGIMAQVGRKDMEDDEETTFLEVEDTIGTGKFGDVLRVRHEHFPGRYALKVVNEVGERDSGEKRLGVGEEARCTWRTEFFR